MQITACQSLEDQLESKRELSNNGDISDDISDAVPIRTPPFTISIDLPTLIRQAAARARASGYQSVTLSWERWDAIT